MRGRCGIVGIHEERWLHISVGNELQFADEPSTITANIYLRPAMRLPFCRQSRLRYSLRLGHIYVRQIDGFALDGPATHPPNVLSEVDDVADVA